MTKEKLKDILIETWHRDISANDAFAQLEYLIQVEKESSLDLDSVEHYRNKWQKTQAELQQLKQQLSELTWEHHIHHQGCLSSQS